MMMPMAMGVAMVIVPMIMVVMMMIMPAMGVIMVMAMMMVMIVMVVMMRMIVMRMCRFVGAAFGLERRFEVHHLGAQRFQQRLDRWITLRPDTVRQKLHRHMAVAEMPGKPR